MQLIRFARFSLLLSSSASCDLKTVYMQQSYYENIGENIIKYAPTLVTDPVKPDPVDSFSSPSKNLASTVTGEIFNFTRPVYGFLGATFTYPAYTICTCLKKATHRQKGAKFADPVSFFPQVGDHIDVTGSVKEQCMDTVVLIR